MPTTALYLLAFLAGIGLLGMLVLRPSLRRVLFWLCCGCGLSVAGLTALSLDILWVRLCGQSPATPEAHLSILAVSATVGTTMSTLLALGLRLRAERARCGTVISAFIPPSGSGLSGRIEMESEIYRAVVPGWAACRPERGDRVRPIGSSANGELLVVLRDSLDDRQWRPHTPDSRS